jgi:ERI1 exoribonuclease 3
MTGMLSYMKLGLEGKHDSGMDDCKNISRIVKKLREETWRPEGDLS